MNIDPAIFKTYDIRGIYPTQINEENFQDIVAAIYTFFLRDLKKDSLKVALGRDMRTSSPALFAVAQKTLMDLGAEVYDVGLVSTPTFYFACLNYGYDAGIQVSASHNPKEYNGIKFAKRVGDRLVKISGDSGINEVKRLALEKDFVAPRPGGKVQTNTTVLTDELQSLFRIVDPKKVKKLKIVADPANAMGIVFLEELFRHLDCELVKMNFTLDGTFPAHQPDPLQFKTLKDIQNRVIAEKADLGIAPDGDGDRVFFINEKGEIIPATLISSLVSQEILSKSAGEKIIVDIRYVKNVQSTVSRLGGQVLLSRVGHSLITEQLNKEDAAFAGESSGHMFFRESGGAESTLRTILHVLAVISRENKPISEILKQFQSAYESGEHNFTLKDGLSNKDIFMAMATQHPDTDISYLDGISISYPNWRFNIRASNTEPLIRLNLEADSAEVLKAQFNTVKQAIMNLGASPKE